MDHGGPTTDRPTESDTPPSHDKRVTDVSSRLLTAVNAGIVTVLCLVVLARAWVATRNPTDRLTAHGFESSAFSSFPETSQMALWALFQGHGTDIVVEQSANEPEISATIADVAVVDPGPLVVVVPLVLAVAGAYCVFSCRPSSPAGAVLTGAAVVLAYAPATLFSTVRAAYDPTAVTLGFEGRSQPGSALIGENWAVGFSISPDPVMALGLAGVIYPVVWCGLGGLVGYLCLERVGD